VADIVERAPGEHALWRRIVDFPLVAMAIAIGLFLVAAGVGQAVGSAIVLSSPVAKMLARNAAILAIVLLTYKFAIARLGTSPRDDLTAKRALPNFAIGILIGFALMAVSVGAAAAAHVYDFLGEGDASQVLHELITTGMMAAFMEEILFRGILFRWIEEFAGSWAALAITSALFGLAHILNPNATWFSSLAIAVEAGLLLGGAYMLTRNLWLPIGLHAAWNFTQGEVFGVPVSGEAVHGLFRSRLSGPPILSGGGFGLEASVIALVIATATGVCFIWLAVRRGEVVQPSWVRARALSYRSAPA
jgi:membrane protease YdiL (CAAX protease family)